MIEGENPQEIVSPVPFAFWDRELIMGSGSPRRYDWGSAYGTVEDRIGSVEYCMLEPALAQAEQTPELEAFLLWTRAPFAERAGDGSVLLRDARFYDPLARDRFTVVLQGAECEELPSR